MRLLLIVLLLSFLTPIFSASFTTDASYQICFTPAQKCSYEIVNYINHTQHNIYIQAFSFTSKRIANALIKAKRRGVQVKVIIDKSELIDYSRIWLLLRADIPVWLDNKVSIAHNKVMIFNNTAIVTGSYNFTNAAEYKNAENLLYIHDVGLAQIYLRNWQQRQQQSVVLTLTSAKVWQKKLAVMSSLPQVG